MIPVLLDSSAIVALLDRSEKKHRHCAETILQLSSPLITCEAVIAESCYLLRNIKGAAGAVLANVEAGTFRTPFVLTNSISRVKKLLHKYDKVPMSFADACLVVLAEEFNTADILTLDSDFSFYRWNDKKAFNFLL